VKGSYSSRTNSESPIKTKENEFDNVKGSYSSRTNSESPTKTPDSPQSTWKNNSTKGRSRSQSTTTNPNQGENIPTYLKSTAASRSRMEENVREKKEREDKEKLKKEQRKKRTVSSTKKKN